jgi:integrase
MPQVALELTKLRRRELFTRDDDLVFAGPPGKVLNYDSLVVRYKAAQKAAGLRPLRFHDLRHSFGTMAVRQFPITDVQTWMGHADIATTRKYIHYAPQPEAAARLANRNQTRTLHATRQAHGLPESALIIRTRCPPGGETGGAVIGVIRIIREFG